MTTQKQTFLQKAGAVGKKVLQGIGGAARGVADAFKQGYENKSNIDKVIQLLTDEGLYNNEIKAILAKAVMQKAQKAKASKSPNKSGQKQMKLPFKEWLLENSK